MTPQDPTRAAAEAAYERLSHLSEEDLVEEIGGKTGAHSLDYMNNLAMFLAGREQGLREAEEVADKELANQEFWHRRYSGAIRESEFHGGMNAARLIGDRLRALLKGGRDGR